MKLRMLSFFLRCRALAVLSFLTVSMLLSAASAPHQAFPADSVVVPRFTVPEIVVPAALTGLSAWAVGNGWLVKKKEQLQDALSAGGKRHIRIDEFTPYLPMAAVYGLNLCGVRGRHSYLDATVILAMSYVTMTAAVYSLKYAFREQRPDGDGHDSFPSGHTATAFMAATFLCSEFSDVSPWIGYAGYATAALTAYLRVYNNRHYVNDVIAGACIGYLSAKFAGWLFPKCFGREVKAHGKTPVSFAGMPFCSREGAGLSVGIVF